MKKILRKLKDKKGSAMIEYCIGLFILVIFICFLTDVIIIAQKQFIVSQQANTLSRQLGIQGGIRTSAPIGYPGGERAYADSREVFDKLNKNFSNAGLKNSEWDIILVAYDKYGNESYRTNLNDRTIFTVDYRGSMNINITYKYKWSIWGQIVPGLKEQTRTTNRHTISEFKYNYDVWDGE
ncbi:TPA: hypothetical protein N2D99_002364 [Clostridium botulinum]|nr:hypothetical protein [Clostridium botulinum]